MRDFLNTNIKVKNVDVEKRLVQGYGAVFNNVDQGGDVIRKGAFTKTIQERFPKGDIKFLYQHDPYNPVGKIMELREDDYGLYFEAWIKEKGQGDEVLEMYDTGIIDTQSIGYRTIQASYSKETIDEKEVEFYELRELKLYEISQVTFPMNELARTISGSKSINDNQFIKRLIDRESKLKSYLNGSKKITDETGLQLESELESITGMYRSLVKNISLDKQEPLVNTPLIIEPKEINLLEQYKALKF